MPIIIDEDRDSTESAFASDGGSRGNRASGLILEAESKSNALRISSSSLEMGGFPNVAEDGEDEGGEKAMTVEFCSRERKLR